MAIQISGTTVIDNSRNITNASIAASLINSGTLATARLGSGTANSSTYLRGDQCWAALPASGFSNMCVFTSPGSFTFPPSTTKFKATVTGGGASGYTNAPNQCYRPGAASGTGIILANVTGGSTIPVTVGSRGTAPSPAGGNSCFGCYLKVCGGNTPFSAASCPGIYRCCTAPCYLACLSMPPSAEGSYFKLCYLNPGFNPCCVYFGTAPSSYWGSASGCWGSPCTQGSPSTYGVGSFFGWCCTPCGFLGSGCSIAAPGVVVIEW